MKIGIITCAGYSNYGGMLQAYAMTQVLTHLGHDPKVIYRPVEWKLRWYRIPKVLPLRILDKLRGKNVRLLHERYLTKTFPLTVQHTRPFVERYIPKVEVKRYEDLQEGDWDGFVVGSDQIWRPAYNIGNEANTYLAFARKWNIKRVAYAASFGTDQWEMSPKLTEQCRNLISLFDYVSVREASGVDLCRKYLGIEADNVVDPTLLLPREAYEKIVENAHVPVSSGTLLTYVLDETKEKQAVVERVIEQYALKPFRVNSSFEDSTAPVEERIQPPVEQWLRGFMDARMVVTDSFHACVFSIIFNRPFVVVGNEGRGLSRFHSLLSLFGLEDRLVTSPADMPANDIDWAEVNARLVTLRKTSVSKLKEALR